MLDKNRMNPEMNDKDRFERRVSISLLEWETQIAKIKNSATKVDVRNLLEFERQVDLLSAKHELVQEKLMQLQLANNMAWDELKACVDGLCNEIENAVDSASAKINA